MKVKVNLRYKQGTNEVRCICKRSDPGCDRFKNCIKEVAYINKFKGIKECFKNSEKKI